MLTPANVAINFVWGGIENFFLLPILLKIHENSKKSEVDLENKT